MERRWNGDERKKQEKMKEIKFTIPDISDLEIENLMNFALGIKMLGVKHMDFKAFDRR